MELDKMITLSLRHRSSLWIIPSEPLLFDVDHLDVLHHKYEVGILDSHGVHEIRSEPAHISITVNHAYLKGQGSTLAFAGFAHDSPRGQPEHRGYIYEATCHLIDSSCSITFSPIS